MSAIIVWPIEVRDSKQQVQKSFVFVLALQNENEGLMHYNFWVEEQIKIRINRTEPVFVPEVRRFGHSLLNREEQTKSTKVKLRVDFDRSIIPHCPGQKVRR